MPFLMIRNDITKVPADAIVNPANKRLLMGSGTSEAIYLSADIDKLTRACNKIGHCDLGKAVITDAFDLPAKYIIHAVGPKWIDGKHNEEKYLYSAYTESMILAKKYHLKSIAFPLLSSGNYKYPKKQAMDIAVKAIRKFLENNDMLVYLVMYDKEAVTISKKLFSNIKEYIDDHYVDEGTLAHASRTSFLEVDYLSSSKSRSEQIKSLVSSVIPISTAIPSVPERKLDDLINCKNKTFSQMLLRLIDERHLKDSDVYKKANIDRRHFSKIRNDINYVPNKKTVFAFSIALELSLDETTDLLMRAGYAFSICSKFDLIIKYFIEKGFYDIFKINEVLFFYKLPLLGE